MDEYIDKEAFKKSVEEHYCKPCKAEGKDHNGCWCRACWVDDMLDEVDCFQPADVEKMSDGYHTFADLYEQRLILSSALAKNNPHAWKSKRHDDGSVPFGGGWFIMGFDTDEGCYTYHYELKDWGLFQCEELDKGKPWDGHTSKDVRRLLSMPATNVAPVIHGRWIREDNSLGWVCSRCGKGVNNNPEGIDLYCYHCGAKMDEKEDKHETD